MSALRVSFVGAACLDIILAVPQYPSEDCEVRVSAVRRAAGGNAANAASVCAQLLPGAAVHLVAPISDAAQDGDAAALTRSLAAAGVCTRGLAVVAASGLPTSYIALAPRSRTILHARSIRELAGGEALAALTCAACAGGGAGAGAWLHAEGRALEATAEALRGCRRGAGAAAGGLRPVLSLELEKTRTDGDVEAVLLPLADVVFVSAEYARAVRGCADAPAAIAHVLAAAAAVGAPPPALIVAPGGEEGAWASAIGAHAGAPRVCAHAPARMPAAGIVVDTLGAGDCFIAAFVAYAVRATAVRSFVHGIRIGALMSIDAAALTAWLAIACGVAGDKVGHEGLQLPAATVDAAQRELNDTAAP